MWSSSITARNNIIWSNTQNSGNQIYGGNSSSFTYSDIEDGFTGTGNINIEPQFVDANNNQLETLCNVIGIGFSEYDTEEKISKY